MSEFSGGQLHRTLTAASDGDKTAASQLLELMYTELRSLAAALMARLPPGNTLQPTALVHEAYLRIAGDEDPGWNGRRHFFASAAEAMRRILVEQARRKARIKHGGGLQRLDADDVDLRIETPVEDMISLDQALSRLERDDAQAAQIVLLRFFSGLTAEETAVAMGLSLSTVERRWRSARTVLYTILNDSRGAR